MSANIYQLPTQLTGTSGIFPNFKFMVTGDNLATITTAGYLNGLEVSPVLPADVLQVLYSFNPVSGSGTYGVFTVSITNGVITLAYQGGSGEVVLPTIVNHIATYTNTTGTLSEDASTAINGGNIQAGLSGTAGYLASFPATAAKGSLRVTGVANTGDTLVTISNALHGQASVYSIPDSGAATANFVVSTTAGGQTIAGGLTVSTGNLAVSAGTVTASGAITSTTGALLAETTATGKTGVVAGTSAGGTAGSLILYSPTIAQGSLRMLAVGNVGDFATTISDSASTGQAQTVTVPNAGAATANFILSASSASAQTISSGLSITGNNNVQTSGGGQFIAGGDAAKGFFISYPTTTASGRLVIEAVDNAAGDFDTTINNGVGIGQDQTLTIPDVGAAAGFLNPQLVTANRTPASVTITKDVTLGFAALAAGGTVDVQAALATAQFKVRNIFVNYGASGLSGGGGDRLVTLTDGTTVYNDAGITAALLGTPVNTVWGGTGNPLAGSVDQSTATVAGEALRFVYSGGTTDYTAGSVVVTVTYERVA